MNITLYLTECIKNVIPVSFSKYGDGEYQCAIGGYLKNCDNDRYTHKLSSSLKESFKYMVENAENAYIGKWTDDDKTTKYWSSLVNKPVKWAKYHTIIFDETNDNEKVELYKAIHSSKIKKIIICNKLLIKSTRLLNIDYMINIPFNNWFDTYFTNVLDTIKNLIHNDEPHIIITCCGMSSKVLICELTKLYKNGIYLDFGSGLDKICTKRETRGFPFSYEYLTNLLKDILPDNWNDSKYDTIYEQAKLYTGLHLGR
jgi:hypothetical protein